MSKKGLKQPELNKEVAVTCSFKSKQANVKPLSYIPNFYRFKSGLLIISFLFICHPQIFRHKTVGVTSFKFM
jgi:hypothetical protein